MTKLSAHFNRSEFECSCGCGFATVDVELIKVLEEVREHFGKSTSVNSSARCASHNESVGGAAGSKHKLGIAADITVSGVSPDEVYEYIDNKYPLDYGLGSYKTFTHVDVRDLKARWGTNK
jgi:uncharacterized protein YcbK (DUF882 family)